MANIEHIQNNEDGYAVREKLNESIDEANKVDEKLDAEKLDGGTADQVLTKDTDNDQEYSWKDAPSGKIEEEITVTGVGDVGGYSDGDVVAQGTELTEFAKGLLIKRIAPTYVSPIASLVSVFNGSQTSAITIEYGENVDASFTSQFTQNDAGAMSQVTYTDNIDGYSCQQPDTVTPCTNIFVVNSPGTTVDSIVNKFRASIHYLEGPTKDDNLGDSDPTGKILEGDVVSSDHFATWKYARFYGVGAPTSNVEIRALTKTFADSFTLNTETTGTEFSIIVPPSKQLGQVIDQDALNADLTADYVYTGDVILSPIDAGPDITYKVYTLTVATPYSSSHRHNVTLNNA